MIRRAFLPAVTRARELLIILSLTLFSYLLVAQTVRHGDASPTRPNAFRSPMVIETVFPANPSLWMDTESLAGFKPGRPTHGKLGEWFSTPEWYALGKFTCDGVSLGELLPGDRLEVHPATQKITLLHPQKFEYYRLLRSKLHWGRGSFNQSE